MWYDVKRQLIFMSMKMHRSPWRHVAMTALGLIVIYIIMFSGRSGSFKIPNGIDLTKYEPFEPVAETDLPSDPSGETRIPKIIHWVSETSAMFGATSKNLKSFVKHNPDWTFYFWTEESSRAMIKALLPRFLPLWDDHAHYKHITARRYEMIKYIVMYQFGGVFLDLSAKNFRSLGPVLTKYSCIIPPNPYEEAIITGVPYTLSTRVMFCRARHPFFKLVIDNLHRYQHMSTMYDSVGEGFFMTQYQVYNTLQRERDDKNIYIQQNRKDPSDTTPYFFQGELLRTHPDAVYVPNSVYFTGRSDPQQFTTYKKVCGDFFHEPFLYQRACVHLHRGGVDRKRGQLTYISLHASVSYVPKFLNVFANDVRSVIPSIKLYGTD